MASRQAGKAYAETKLFIEKMANHKISHFMGGASLYCKARCNLHQGHNIQLDNRNGAGFPQGTVRPHMQSSSRFNELVTKSEKWYEMSRLACDHVVMFDIHLQRPLWIYCPGHAGIKGNDRADRLASKATTTSGLHLGRSKKLRSIRHYLQSQRQGHYTNYCLEGSGQEKGSSQRSSLKG